MICFAVGSHRFGLEVEAVESLVSPDESTRTAVDPAAVLGLTRWRTSQLANLQSAPVSVVLGEDPSHIEYWDVSRIASLPRWMLAVVPDLFKPACGLSDTGQLVWILDPRSLVDHCIKDES